VFASSRAALQAYRKLAPKTPVGSIEELLRLAEEGNPAGVKAVAAQAAALGRGLRMITAALSPELILITGEITSCWKRSGKVEWGCGNIAATSLQVPSLNTRRTGREAGSCTEESQLNAFVNCWTGNNFVCNK
jgi:predicted NBD/HSP70 family sugar kinase